MKVLHSIWKVLVPPLIVGVLFVGTWQIIVRVFDLQPFLLPAPSAIASTFGDNWNKVLDAMFVTGAERVGRARLRCGLRCGTQLRAHALQRGERTGHPAGRRVERDPDHRARAGLQQHVREHHRGASPVDGHLDRVFIVLLNVARASVR